MNNKDKVIYYVIYEIESKRAKVMQSLKQTLLKTKYLFDTCE